MNNYHTPERMVLAGVGVEHEEFVNLAKDHFVNTPAIWKEDSELVDRTGGFDDSVSQYTGGIIQASVHLMLWLSQTSIQGGGDYSG